MVNLTIVVDDEVLKQARIRALEQGTSVNALLREYLEAYAGEKGKLARATADVLALARASEASSRGRRWHRDDIYDQAVRGYQYPGLCIRQRRAGEAVHRATLAGDRRAGGQHHREYASPAGILRRGHPKAAAAVRAFADYPLRQVDVALILRAIERNRASGLSFWDALTVETAIDCGCEAVLTEDMQHGQVFDAVEIRNPFL